MGVVSRASEADLHLRRARRLDLVGVVLVATSAAWAAFSAGANAGARPRPFVALLAAGVVVFMIGRWSARLGTAVLPTGIAVGVSAAIVLGFPDILAANGGPTGYANSNATLAALGAISAGGVSALSTSPSGRRAWLLLALGLGAGTAATGSMAGALALAGGVGLLAAAVTTRSPLPVMAGGLIAALLALGITSSMALGADPLGMREQLEARVELWSGAVAMLRDEPLTGVGPGRFEETSPSSDADLRWAHNEYLQQAAEQGVPGLVLTLGLLAWIYVRLLAVTSGRARMLAAGAAVSVVALHASVDHVAHSAAVILTLAALAGWGTADRRRRHSQAESA